MEKGNLDLDYLVVEFLEDIGICSVEVIPKLWFNAHPDKEYTHALWPSHIKDSTRIRSAAKRGDAPSDRWKCYKIKRVLFETSKYCDIYFILPQSIVHLHVVTAVNFDIPLARYRIP
jgi:hypothetical protein